MDYQPDDRAVFKPQMAPGFFTEGTDTSAQNRWKDGDKVRFKNGRAEKFGGWASVSIGGAVHYGVPRRAHEWTSLDGEAWIAYGTNKKLYLLNRDLRYDITPVRRWQPLGNNPFTTTMGSQIVQVSDPGHSSNVGDFVRFSAAAAVAGITINGEYEITGVIDGNLYQITHSAPANASTTGGGASVVAEYDINSGAESEEPALGYGVCGYGEGTYGTARSALCSGVLKKLLTWSLDNFGEDLIASPRGGAVYHWDRTNGPLARAVVLPDAPQTNQRVLISNSGGQIICLGAFDPVAGGPDPMLVRVGAEESLTEFTVDDENTAFDERLATGSTTITGVRTSGGVLIGTDEAVYIMQEDSQLVYRIRKVGEGNAPIGPNAMIEVDGTAYYMSPFKFMAYDGVLDELPCEVWQRVFGDEQPTRIDRSQVDKVYCWYNEKFSEIWWLYPSVGGTGECDQYVIFNKFERVWYFGSIERTAAISPGPTYDLPVALDPDGVVFQHENGVDDDGEPLDAFIESHDLELSDAQTKMRVDRAVRDMKRQVGTVSLILKGKDWPGDNSYVMKGPYGFSATTTVKGVEIEARQVAVRFSSDTLGASWRLGDWKFYVRPTGEE